MDGFIEIRGVAAPYNVTAALADGMPTILRPQCFALAGRNVHLLAGHHGAVAVASTLYGTLDLFEMGDFGLGFRAWIAGNRAGYGVLGPIARGSMSGCSVSMNKIFASHAAVSDGTAVMVITRTALDHVALCSSPCYGDWTGAWLADAEDVLPPRLSDFATRWRAGMAAHQVAQRLVRRAA